MTAEILLFEPRRPPAVVGPLSARLDHPRVRSGGARGPLLTATLTLTLDLASVPLVQRQTLTQMLQSGRRVTLTLTPVIGENPDPEKSPGAGPNRPRPDDGLPR